MSAPFHSPAPWSVNSSGGAMTIVARDRSVVAVIVGGGDAAPFEVGNSHLLAAAPALYVAVEAALERFDDDIHGRPPRTHALRYAQALRDALAKARGDGR